MATVSGGLITGFLCETTSTDCENEANFSVTSAVTEVGRIWGVGGKNRYDSDRTIPRITFEGSLGSVARVEWTDVTLSGIWFHPFTVSPATRIFVTQFTGTIETFDGSDSSISGPTAFSVSLDDPFTASPLTLSFCTATAVETGQCSLFLDTDTLLTPGEELDVNGTPQRVLLNFASLVLNGTCGNGVLDPGEECDDGNEISGDCCDFICGAEPSGGACDDGSVCTLADTCDGTGLCLGAPLLCDDANGCTDDACDSVTGCFFVDNSAPCDDGVFCNGADTCGSGSCLIHAGDPCPGPDGDGFCAESCSEAASDCTTADPDGSSCTDGNVCTSVDVCASGSCAPGDPQDCDDGLECTADSCDELTGCAHDPIEFCFEKVPTGGSALWLLTALTLAGFGLWKLIPRVEDSLR